MKDLTEKQKEVLDFCREAANKNGRFPTQREIIEHFGLKSTMSSRTYMVALEKKGKIEKVGNYYRIVKTVDHEALLANILKADGAAAIALAIRAARKAVEG